MGKTTLALSALHDPEVVNRYERRFFLSCEGLSSIPSFLGELANLLCIPPSQRNQHLYEVVLTAFRPMTAILCLDNFETIWDNDTCRSEVEKLLSHFNSMPELALMTE